ncbi:MAG TPA: hypothetical protein VNT03_06525 [Baekduia sp.]|nr:hypothetical protein [Baekduia sp.]
MIDFTVAPELDELPGRVKTYISEDVLLKLAMSGESTNAATGDLA